MQANQWRGPMLDPTAPPPPPPVRIPPLNAAAILLNARRKESSEAAFIKQARIHSCKPAFSMQSPQFLMLSGSIDTDPATMLILDAAMQSQLNFSVGALHNWAESGIIFSCAFSAQIVGLEVSPALAGADVIEQWMKRLPDGAAAAAAKEASSRRSAQLSQCYISTVLLPGEGQTPVLSATAENKKAFVDLVQLFHAHPEARSGTYGMFLLTGEQHASGYL